MPIIGVVTRGLPKLDANFRVLASRAMIVSNQSLFRVGQAIKNDADRLVPFKTGKLRNSGFVLSPVGKDLNSGASPPPDAMAEGQKGIVIGYGSAEVPYALVQHERTDFHHAVGQAKYLETPWKFHASRVVAQLAIAMGQEVKRRTP